MAITLPLNWLLAAIIAAAVHELFHAAAVFLCGGNLYSIHIGIQGAQIVCSTMSRPKSLICILAGPMGSFLLLSLCYWFPRTAICGFFHGVYNLLPFGTLDGARALHCLLDPFIWGKRILSVLEIMSMIVIVIFCLVLWRCDVRNPIPILLLLILMIQKNSLQTGETQGTIVLPWIKR